MATYTLLESLDLVEKSLKFISKEGAWSHLHVLTITLTSI